jgi:hypothetical protein
MEDIEDARNYLCCEERIASEYKEIRMAMRMMPSKHLLPDIGEPFLDGSLRNLARPPIGFSLRSQVQRARSDYG